LQQSESNSQEIPTIVTFLAFATASDSFKGPSKPSAAPFPSGIPSPAFSLQGAATDTSLMTTGTTWSEDTENRHTVLERCMIPLSASSYKGSSGRVGVLGGSAKYTGAPYYAAMASLKCGADLAFCFCAEEAAVPLKTYSAELMVQPVYNAGAFDKAVRGHESEEGTTEEAYDDEETKKLVHQMVEDVCSMMEKMHVLVLGPGLGRCPLVFEATARIIQRAQSEYHLPLVIDADALFLLTLPKYHNLLTDDSLVILTPNAMELRRLRDSHPNAEGFPARCIVIEKGAVDSIRPGSTNSAMPTIACGEVGGLKRSGGIGDILAGTCGTLVAWNRILTNRNKSSEEDLPLACWTACCFVKRATKKAFDRHRRSMTAPDILEELGPAIDEMTF